MKACFNKKGFLTKILVNLLSPQVQKRCDTRHVKKRFPQTQIYKNYTTRSYSSELSWLTEYSPSWL